MTTTLPNWTAGQVLSVDSSAPQLLYASEFSPASRVIHGDCISYMEGVAGKEAYRLLFADPPYNIGVSYDGYPDDLPEKEFFDWTFNWVWAAYELLLPGGIIVVAVPDLLAMDILYVLRHSIRAEFVNWIIWHYRFGQCTDRKFINSKLHIIAFKKPGDHVWNPDAVLVQSDRAAKYGDARIEESSRAGLRVPLDVWGSDVSSLDGELLSGDGSYWGRVTGSHSNGERRPGHDNQLPELLLARVIKAWTNEGDWIMDPFGGSGTTLTVARALGRHCTTVEQSEKYCHSIVERLQKGAVRV